MINLPFTPKLIDSVRVYQLDRGFALRLVLRAFTFYTTEFLNLICLCKVAINIYKIPLLSFFPAYFLLPFFLT